MSDSKPKPAKFYSYVVAKRPEDSKFTIEQQSPDKSENIAYYSMHVGVRPTNPDTTHIKKVVFYVPGRGAITKTKDQGFEIGITSYQPRIKVSADVIMDNETQVSLDEEFDPNKVETR